MALTPLSLLTSTGTSRLSLVPSPSCPKLLLPQAFTVSLPSKARPCSFPAEIARTPFRPLTATGDVLQALLPASHVSGPVVVPSPSCPDSLLPQAVAVFDAACAGA